LVIAGVLALVAAIGVGLWVGSTLGEGERTSTLMTPAPTATATTGPPTVTPTPSITTAAPTPTVITLPPPVPETPPPPEPAAETPDEEVVPPPTISDIRARPISAGGCIRPWTAQVVVEVEGDVSAVSAIWVPAAGGDATETALSAAGNGWAGQLENLPPRTELQLTIRAAGSGGTAESDGQTLAFPCER
jgi:hypothetical protein